MNDYGNFVFCPRPVVEMLSQNNRSKKLSEDQNNKQYHKVKIKIQKYSNIIILILAESTDLYKMTEVNFYDPLFIPDSNLTYSVISAKFEGKWIFVRHQNRLTWEIAGGHIENGETSSEAAGRELMEETGAIKFNLDCIATYSVKVNGETGWGRLYFAEVLEIGLIPDKSEILEIILSDHLPENLTYPDIQPYLFNRVIKFLENR